MKKINPQNRVSVKPEKWETVMNARHRREPWCPGRGRGDRSSQSGWRPGPSDTGALASRAQRSCSRCLRQDSHHRTDPHSSSSRTLTSVRLMPVVRRQPECSSLRESWTERGDVLHGGPHGRQKQQARCLHNTEPGHKHARQPAAAGIRALGGNGTEKAACKSQVYTCRNPEKQKSNPDRLRKTTA